MNVVQTYPIGEKVALIIDYLIRHRATVKQLQAEFECDRRTIQRLLARLKLMGYQFKSLTLIIEKERQKRYYRINIK